MSEQKRFDEVFDKGTDVKRAENTFLSPMACKLKERKNRNIVDQYVSWLKKWDDAEKKINSDSANEDLFFAHTLIERGKHFTEPVDRDVVTALYEIYKSWSHATKTKYYYVKKTESTETIMPDGSKYVTYYIDNPQKEGNQIVLLHFDKAEKHVLINSGILIDDELRVAQKPIVYEYNAIEKSKPRDDNFFQLDNMTESEKEDFLSGVSTISEYDIDVDSTIITIDTETFQPVPKDVYIENGEYKAKIRIKSGRNYFSFQIRTDDGINESLSDFEIAKCYYYGMGDFPKDIVKAAEIFEQIGDADSLYLLAHIWLDESHSDVDSLTDGIFYLEQAAQMGHVAAKAELVYYTMKLLCNLPADEQNELIKKYHERIKSAVDTEIPGALFLAAYVYEKGLFVERNTDLSFSYYFCAAQAGNLAAKARIGMAPVGSCQNEDECRNYFKNSTDMLGFAEYVMGWFLADDPDVMVVTDDILYFYELAAKSGIVSAIRELAEVYMSGNSYIEADPAKAIMWYEKLTDIDDDTAVKLANYYLDGKGCTAGPENDAKALRLLSETVKKYENGSAYNNLGWMYKIGRGCEAPDYMQALRLFEKAAALECGRAYYHLGDIYEIGLGVECNIKTALKYYQKGVELEDKKCIERLNSFSISESIKVPNDQVISLLTDIHEQVSEINAGTARMEQKLDQLLNFIENDLSSVITAARKKIQTCPEDDDTAVTDFIESTATYINQTMASPDALVEQETRQLQLLFGKSWDRLLATSRTSLVSAGVLWKSCASVTKDNFDFSGVCISATSALESELKRVFYTGFQNFLEARYGKPDTNNWKYTFANWPEKLLSCTQYDFKKSLYKYSRGNQKWKPTIEKGSSFTMGVLPFIFGKPEKFRNPDQERLLHTRLMEYLSTIVEEAYVNNPLEAFYKQKDKGCFVEKSECVRKDYRNKAAHVDVVSRDQAEGCYQQVIGKMDAYEYTSDVTGLIMELYDRLR